VSVASERLGQSGFCVWYPPLQYYGQQGYPETPGPKPRY